MYLLTKYTCRFGSRSESPGQLVLEFDRRRRWDRVNNWGCRRYGPALMAHILTCKYGDDLSLYRLGQIFEHHGIDLDRFTLSNWVGKSTKFLEHVSNAIRDYALAAGTILWMIQRSSFYKKGAVKDKTSQRQRDFGIMCAMSHLRAAHHPLRFGIYFPPSVKLITLGRKNYLFMGQ